MSKEPQVFTWEQIAARHPKSSYARDDGIDWAARTLAHATEEDPEVMRFVDDLQYKLKTVPMSRMPETMPGSEHRVQSALEGYREGRRVPPVVLVHRAGEYHFADGHHRTTAQKRLGRTRVRAYVVESPETTPYPERSL